MKKSAWVLIVVCAAVCLTVTSVALAAQQETFGQKTKNFWNKLWGYPGRLTEESATVITDTTKGSTSVVTKTVKNTGSVVSGDLKKTEDLIKDPVIGTTETVGEAAKGIIEAPVEAAKEKEAALQ